MTHVTLPNGEAFEVLNIIDDHSRVCVASRVMHVVRAHDVVRVLHKSAETWGYPASLLTDNGLIFTARAHFGIEGIVEQELFALGITAKHSRPYHPAGSRGPRNFSVSQWPCGPRSPRTQLEAGRLWKTVPALLRKRH